MNFISIENSKSIPKYKQIVISIENSISKGLLKKDAKIPSINKICKQFSVSRDTVLVAYNQLKNKGLTYSIPGKGYYVKTTNLSISRKIFILFDEFNAFKEDLYNSFINNLDKNSQVDIYFHHFNYKIFCELINDNIGNYDYYIIMPANLKKADQAIKELPDNKVYILDQFHKNLSNYSAIYQNFEKNIFDGLSDANELLKKYNKLVLLFQEKQPIGMKNGFVKFCKQNSFSHKITDNLENISPNKNEVFVIPDDRNLIVIMKKIKNLGLKLGESVGIISYNDTLLKEILEGGITTISTDFKEMGKKLAKMIGTEDFFQIENKNSLIIRKSL